MRPYQGPVTPSLADMNFSFPAQAAHLSVLVPGRPEASQPQLRAQRGELVPGLRQLQHQPPRQPSAQPQPGGLGRLQRRLSARW